MNRWWWMLLPLVLLAIPLALRNRPVVTPLDVPRLVIVTPHTETVRREFAEAFTAWLQRERHQTVIIDWRTPGGTADIRRLVDDRFLGVMREHVGSRFSAQDIKAFNDSKLDSGGDTATQRVRAEFLTSELGIGIDLMFGGGSFDLGQMAAKGYLVDAGLIRAMPDTFRPDVIPQTVGGEAYYDPRGRWYGVCLASFGICASVDRMAALGITVPPTTWDDLGDPRYVDSATMADPSKSGAVNRCFEMMIQTAMAKVVGSDPATPEQLDAGWRDGLLLIKRIAANSRSVSDGGSRVVRDVGRGDAAVGMAIDTYAQTEAAWTTVESGRSRLTFTIPKAGTSWSADPIGLFRGAPQRDLALAFMRFCLSPSGQRLWHHRAGTPAGPRATDLRRAPIRRDSYGPDDRALMTDPTLDPYATVGVFTYRAAWTGPWFGVQGTLIRAVVLDARDELRAAWRAIIVAGGPDAVPDAMAELAWLPFAHNELAAIKEQLTGPASTALPLVRNWTIAAQEQYRKAERLARAHMELKP